MLSDYCEIQSHKNCVHMYHEQILLLMEGYSAGRVFATRNEQQHLSKFGVLERYRDRGGSRLVPTSTTLKYMREYCYIDDVMKVLCF